MSTWTQGFRECTYTEADPTHDPHTLQFLPILLRDHVPVDSIETQGALVVVPPQRKVQDGDAIGGGEHNVIIYL